MKRKIFRVFAIAMVGVTGVFATGCAPMVYDSNPHFSHHRVPPKPLPGQPGYGQPGYVRPGYITPAPTRPGQISPNRPGNQPAQGTNRPVTQPDNNPNTGNPNTGRPGNNHR